MSGVPLETCWAFKKLWNNKFYYKAASCWYFYCVIYDARIHEYQIWTHSPKLLWNCDMTNKLFIHKEEPLPPRYLVPSSTSKYLHDIQEATMSVLQPPDYPTPLHNWILRTHYTYSRTLVTKHFKKFPIYKSPCRHWSQLSAIVAQFLLQWPSQLPSIFIFFHIISVSNYVRVFNFLYCQNQNFVPERCHFPTRRPRTATVHYSCHT